MTENIEVFKQNSIRISSSKGMIYVDPFKMDNAPCDAAFILITHDHYDHFSPEDIEKVKGKDTVLIVPENMADKACQIWSGRMVTVKPGSTLETDGLKLETVPSYNIAKRFHPKNAGWVGYILNPDGKRIYVAGDTDATDDAKKVRCDIALVPIGGTYTMDPKEAAGLINEIQPETAIPVHYGSIVGNPSDQDEFARFVKDTVKVVFKIKF